MVLDNSVAGLINLNLVEAQTVRSAGSAPYNHNDYGNQFLYGIPKYGSWDSLDQQKRKSAL